MKPVEVSRNEVNNRSNSTDNPPIRLSTVEVRLGEQYRQILRFLLTRGRWTKQGLTLIFVLGELSRLIGILYPDVVRELPHRIQSLLAPVIGQEEVIPLVDLVGLYGVVALRTGTVVDNVDRVIGRLSNPVRRFVEVVKAVGTWSEEGKRSIEWEGSIPRRIGRIDVKEDPGSVDVVHVGGDIRGGREVVVKKSRLAGELPGFVQLLEHVAVEEGPVEGHVVCVQQLGSVRVDDVAEQTVELGLLGDRVRR